MKGRVRLKQVGLLLSLSMLWSPPSGVLAEEAEPHVLTLEQAIKIGLEQNLDIKKMELEVKVQELQEDKAGYYADKLKDADKAIAAGWDQYNTQKNYFDSIKESLPADVRAQMEAQLAGALEKLQANSQYSIDTLQEAQVKDLLEEKAKVGLQLTSLGNDLSKTKVRLLITKTYYEALQQKALVDVKTRAYDRARGQYKLAQAGYEEGMKAKDDVLLTEVQVALRRADLAKAKVDYQNGLLELKEVLNLPQEEVIELQEDLTFKQEAFNLAQGLEQGLKERLEVQKAAKELYLNSLNLVITEKYTAPNTFDYKEAALGKQRSELNLEQAKRQLETEIRQSYNLVQATGQIADLVQGTVEKAKANLEIADFKYKEGFISPSANLKSIDLEEAAGTMMEVLAAQETLAQVEEQYVKAVFGYNLAKAKYLNDIMADKIVAE